MSTFTQAAPARPLPSPRLVVAAVLAPLLVTAVLLLALAEGSSSRTNAHADERAVAAAVSGR